MKKIKEVIVVEGRDDISAVKRAVEAELIEVNGFAVRRKSTLEKIKFAQERKGVIVLCDPDFAGEKIRKTIEDYVPNVKHAYISRKEGTKKDNIGVENASPEAIIKALEGAKFKEFEGEELFSMADLWDHGLVGSNDSKDKRSIVGTELRIGYANAKQFLNKLNNFGITKEEFEKACAKASK
jgi:ribonuclease M5